MRIDRLLKTMRDPVTDSARLGENVQLAVRNARPRNHHGAKPVGKPALSVQHDLVVSLIHHGLDMQPARETQRILHFEPVLDRGVFKFQMRKDMIRLKRELFLRADEMKMRIAGSSRQFQLRLRIVAIDFRREWTSHASSSLK